MKMCQNSANVKKRNNCSSIYKGVTWHRRDKKWVARVNFEGKVYSCGYFDNEVDGAKAYDDKIVELFGEYATTNKSLGLLEQL